MDRPTLLAIVIVFMVLLLVLMFVGWRTRKRRQRSVATPASVPQDVGASLGRFDGQYVVTTAAGQPLDRIAVHGLGFPGRAAVEVSEGGILVQIDGTSDKWIPAADLKSIGKATWTTGRVVEQDGLELVEWNLGDKLVDSYFRIDDHLDFEFAVDKLLAKKAS